MHTGILEHQQVPLDRPDCIIIVGFADSQEVKAGVRTVIELKFMGNFTKVHDMLHAEV